MKWNGSVCSACCAHTQPNWRMVSFRGNLMWKSNNTSFAGWTTNRRRRRLAAIQRNACSNICGKNQLANRLLVSVQFGVFVYWDSDLWERLCSFQWLLHIAFSDCIYNHYLTRMRQSKWWWTKTNRAARWYSFLEEPWTDENVLILKCLQNVC